MITLKDVKLTTTKVKLHNFIIIGNKLHFCLNKNFSFIKSIQKKLFNINL